MSWRTLGTVCVCAMAAVMLADPIAKRVFVEEVNLATGLKLSAESFHCSPLRGYVSMTDVAVDSNRMASADEPDSRTSFSTDYLWVKANTRDLFYRRLNSPIAVARGVHYELRAVDLQQLPQLDSHVATVANTEPDIEAIVDPMFKKLDAIFAATQQNFEQKTQSLSRTETQLSEIERALRSSDNPLRSRQEARELQKELATLKKILAEAEAGITGIIKPYDDELNQIRMAWLNKPDAGSESLPILDDKGSQRIAQQLIDNLAASQFASWHPQLGLTRQLIQFMRVDAETMLPSETAGKDYGFNERSLSRFEIGKLLVSGEVKNIGKSFPFQGQLMHVGDGNIEAACPAVKLVFEEQAQQNIRLRREITAKVLPDGPNFLLRAQSVGVPSEMQHLEADRYGMNCQMKDVGTQLVWFVQGGEWSAELTLTGAFENVAPCLNTGKQSVLRRLEKLKTDVSCYASSKFEVLLQARMQGKIVEGRLVESERTVESPALPSLATAIRTLNQNSNELSSASAKESVLKLLVERSQQHKARLASQRSLMTQSVANASKRTNACTELVAATLNSSGNLRVATPPTPNLTR